MHRLPGWVTSLQVIGSRKIRNLALIGFMGSGKSSIGRATADLMRFQFVDTDELIETRAKKRITEIFAQDGETAFRQWESKIVSELEQAQGLIISTGGGLPTHQPNLDSLKQHSLVVCLWASPEKIYERVKTQTHRPLLHVADPLDRIRTLLAERKPAYKQADVLVISEGRTVREVAQQLAAQFHLASKTGA